MKLLQDIGGKVKSNREIIGMSQEELAHRSNIHRTYLSNIECGKRNFSITVLFQIAAALGIEIKDLLE
jgi:transcriptional regulator with XRE-family HTH domain